METVLGLKDFLNLTLPRKPTDAEWLTLAQALDRLHPIAAATAEVEKDSANFTTVANHIQKIKEHWSDQNSFTIFNTAALRHLQHRCEKNFTGTLSLLCKAFMPDTVVSSWPTSERQKLQDTVGTYFLPLLKKFGHDDDILPALRGQLGRWVLRLNALSVPDPLPDPISYWESISIEVPLLAKVALTILSICPSEACVERCFSAQGLIHSELRANLDDDSIRALMSVRMNILRLYDVPCMERKKKPAGTPVQVAMPAPAPVPPPVDVASSSSALAP